MARQSADSSLAQRVRAAMAVTVAVFALSLSYWGVLVKQESQASTAGMTTINFDDRVGNIDGATYHPDLLIKSIAGSATPSTARILKVDNVNCPNAAHPSPGNALYLAQGFQFSSAMLDIKFTNSQVSDQVSLNLASFATAGRVTVQAIDASGGVIVDEKYVDPVANTCLNTLITLSKNSSAGIAQIRIYGAETGNASWGIDDFSYSTLRGPITDFGFTATPPTGTAPLTVTVTYTGKGSSTPPLTWDFGDGQVVENGSTTITHTYASVGTYPIKLTSGTLVAQNTVIVSAAIPLPTPLTFSVTPMMGTAPLNVTGSSPTSSADADVKRSWNWGDDPTITPVQQQSVCTNVGSVATCNWQNTSHTYNAPGTYIVTVTQVYLMTGAHDPNIQTDKKTIVVSANTINDAILTTSKSVYDVGEQVQFALTNIGLNALTLANTAPFKITSGATTVFSPIGGQVVTQLIPSKNQGWTWDQKNTTSTQVAEGVYTVTVSYTNGTEAKTKSATFTVAKQATAPTFTYKIDPTSGTAPLTVKATVTGTGADATAPLWDFGDGATATGTSVSHTYLNAGIYTATVRIGSQVGSQTIVVSKAIDNTPIPVTTVPKKLVSTGMSLSLILLIALIISGIASYLIIRRPFHSNDK